MRAQVENVRRNGEACKEAQVRAKAESASRIPGADTQSTLPDTPSDGFRLLSSLRGETMKDGAIKECIGYGCGTVIIVVMLFTDGASAIAAAMIGVGAMFGAQAYANRRREA